MPYPLDDYTVRFAIGSRRLLTTYTGPLWNVQRLGDMNTLDIDALPDGSLDAATFYGFVAGDDAIVLPYDQVSGTLLSAQVAPYAAGGGVGYESPNAIPGMTFGSSLIYLALGSTFTSDSLILAAMLTMNNATEEYGSLFSAWPTDAISDIQNEPALRGICRLSLADQITAFRVSELSTVTVDYDTPIQITAVFDGAEHTELVDGVAAAPTASTGMFTFDTLALGGGLVVGMMGSPAWYGNLWEVALIEGATGYADIAAEQRAYYGSITPPTVTTTSRLTLLGVG